MEAVYNITKGECECFRVCVIVLNVDHSSEVKKGKVCLVECTFLVFCNSPLNSPLMIQLI